MLRNTILVMVQVVDGEGHLPRPAVLRAGVRIGVVLRQQIHVVKDDTLEFLHQLLSLVEANVHQHSAVERRITVCHDTFKSCKLAKMIEIKAKNLN